MRILFFLIAPAVVFAQPQATPLGAGPWTYTTYEKNTRIRVSVVTRGLSHPWGLVFLPSGDMLVTERPGRVRLIHNGVVAPGPVADLSGLSVDVLFDIALHPDFANNGFVYLTYIKKGKAPDGGSGYWATTALARGKFDGKALTGVQDIFVADAWQPLNGGDGSRVAFGPDGKIYLSSSHRRNPDAPQDLNSDVGKILRLNDDGSIPKDNPFVGKANAKPEIYSWGHRTVLGLTFKPGTSELWETENGPQGGDEVNVIKAGKNYGWPLVSYAVNYDGVPIPSPDTRPDLTKPVIYWTPVIAPGSLTFYNGDMFPQWKGSALIGGMASMTLNRITFDGKGGATPAERWSVGHRIRDVEVGPDGALWMLEDTPTGGLFRVTPKESSASK